MVSKKIDLATSHVHEGQEHINSFKIAGRNDHFIFSFSPFLTVLVTAASMLESISSRTSCFMSSFDIS
jgi:hypothetical protein